ncbi:glycosyltransferase family 2 protein [Tsuneonella sp. HG249]
MRPTVAAVIPTVGRAELVRAVRSVHEQSYLTTVIVVVAKPDLTSSIRASLADAHLHAHVVVGPFPLNGSQARNLGVEAASTDLVAFLDDDDFWIPTKVERQVEALVARPGRHAVSTSAAMLGRAGQRRDAIPVPVVPYRCGLVADYLLARHRSRYGYQFMQTSCLMGWRESFLAIPWDPNLPKHQDWDLLIRMIDQAGLHHVFVGEPLTIIAADSEEAVSRAPRWEDSLQWLQTLKVGSRSRNDFILSIAATAAVRARSATGLAASIKALALAVPHFGALAALANELLATGFPKAHRTIRQSKGRHHLG